MKLKLLTLIVFFGTLTTAQGQWRDMLYENDYTNSHIDFGMLGGAAFYHGELSHDWFPNYGYGTGGGLYFKRFFNKSFGFRSSFQYYKNIYAHDSTSVNYADRQRNLRFHTNVLEANVGFELNLIPFGRKYKNGTPYIFGGLSAFYFNPWTDSANGKGRIYLRPLGTEGQNTIAYPDRKAYALISTALTFGGGIKFLVAQKVTIGAEVQFRYCSTDYLDDVSRTYVNLDTLTAYKGAQSAQYSFRGDELEGFDHTYPNNGFQRGNPNDKDWFYTANLTFGIYFDTQEKSKVYPGTRCIRRRINNPVAF